MPSGLGGYMTDSEGKRLDELAVVDAATLPASVGGLPALSELVRSVDLANTVQTLVANAYTPLDLPIAVRPTTRQVVLEYGVGITVLTAGNGQVGGGIVETTTGVAVEVAFQGKPGAPLSAGLYSAANFIEGRKLLDPSPTWRFYRLMAGYFQDAGSAVTANVTRSGAGGTVGDRSPYLRAVLA